MKLLLNNKNIIFDFGADIIYAKPGAADGGLMPCEKLEATHIWNREKNMAYMANKEIIMIDIDNIPEEVQVEKYKYENGNFIINQEYIEYHSDRERIEALENVVNMLLLGGQN